MKIFLDIVPFWEFFLRAMVFKGKSSVDGKQFQLEVIAEANETIGKQQHKRQCKISMETHNHNEYLNNFISMHSTD